jgi:tetratricopeptide (TPR) repeat protein
MKNYERALSIQLTHLPPRHPSLVETYKSMATVQYSLKDYAAALSLYDKVLQIQQSSLRPNDSSLAETHNCIATILEDLGRYKEAIEHVSKAINIAHEASGPNRVQAQNYEQYHERLVKKLNSMLNSTDISNE